MDQNRADNATTESLNSVENGRNEAIDQDNAVNLSPKADKDISVQEVQPQNKSPELPLTSETPQSSEEVMTEQQLSPAPSVKDPDESIDGQSNSNSTDGRNSKTAVLSIDNPELELEEEIMQSGKEIDALHDKNIEPNDNQPSVDEWDQAKFEEMDIEQLVASIKKLTLLDDAVRAISILSQMTPVYNSHLVSNRQQALEKFIEQGGKEDDFQYKPEELFTRFEANARLIRDKKSAFVRSREKEKQNNLQQAEKVLEKLREFVESEESSASFQKFKDIQKEWKAIGDVPAQHSRKLWANYRALLYRFYDQRSIYFELKELDRKKNYDLKLALCEKAEALAEFDNLKETISKLNDLHHEYKHIGPVPRAHQEDLWQRFKSASDAIYAKRKEYVTELKGELQENLVKKQSLAEEAEKFARFSGERISDWNKANRQMIELQKKWEKIGGLPKDKAKAVNRKFWSNFKVYFANKNRFFKQLEATRTENLNKKEKLIEQAETLKESTEWQKTAEQLKQLQRDWREIGPVPERKRKAVNDRFKHACDHFFDRRRSESKVSQANYQENKEKKYKLIKQILECVKDADQQIEFFNKARKEYEEIGFVPKKDVKSLQTQYSEAVEAFLDACTTMDESTKKQIIIEAQLGPLLKSDHLDEALLQREQSMRRQISKLEDDIAIWENNLEFFAHSKSADKLRTEVNKKVELANSKLNQLRQQLKVIQSL